MSGIGEAFLDGIPMLVIAGGVRTDGDKSYQLHQFDQIALAKPITKAQFSVEKHEDIIPVIFEAYNIANRGEPGPVFVEIPVNLLLFSADVGKLPIYEPEALDATPDEVKIAKAVELIKKAKAPMLFVGWGAVDAHDLTVKLAEQLAAPVSTSLQGKSSFPNTHPLYCSEFLGAAGKPSGQWALARHDLMIAIGVRFGEIATGSYGLEPPKNLIHIDINPEVFDKNFKSTLAITGDARLVVEALLAQLEDFRSADTIEKVGKTIREKNEKYHAEWLVEKNQALVSPGHFFRALQARFDRDAQMVVDDGKHTFLASELFAVDRPRHFISPTDFNCMGYCVPGAIAAKLANPHRQVIAIVGDGAFLMTGIELVTAADLQLPMLVFVFNDGELGQISQFQRIPLNRKTCAVVGQLDYAGMAQATGCNFVQIANDLELEEKMEQSFALLEERRPVIVEVKIDYSKKTMLTKGVVKVNLKRFPFGEKVRFLSRALKRHVLG
jgi:acetolactate synthase-1/2/3 large subunit